MSVNERKVKGEVIEGETDGENEGKVMGKCCDYDIVMGNGK